MVEQQEQMSGFIDSNENQLASSSSSKSATSSTLKKKDKLMNDTNEDGDGKQHEDKGKTSTASTPVSTSSLAAMKMPDYFEIDYNDLEIFERCGRGSYGMVYRGLWKSRNKQVAIKKLLQLENEADVLSSCSHRNIIQFYGIVSKASNYCIITEYAEYGSLQSFIASHDLYDEYGFSLILNWAHDIALGMNYLHSEAPLKIIHRDLKSNNVLITGDEMTCKICDFGSSRFGIQTTKMTITGTFPWMSPEIIQSKPANQSCDIWSYGVVLWELITGEIPFKGIEEFQIAFLVVEKDYRLPIPNGCPPVFTNLMRICWQNDPKLRPTFKQILATLDDIDLDATAKAEIDNLFTKNKAKWEIEIEQAFERLKKIEDDLQIKEKLLEAKERRLREIEMEYITSTSRLIHLEDHDVNTWREVDVCEWIKKIGQKLNRDGIADYCDKFLNHNINGKRLLLMNKADLRSIGITSEGHIIDLHHEIETLKLENIRLLNFPPLKQRTTSKSQLMIRTISYNLLIGLHIMKALKPEDTKWKMYADFDECDDSKEINIHSCIRDVKFVTRSQFEQFNIGKPPFIMKNWIRGIQDDLKVNCVITYQDKVLQPRKTTVEYKLNSIEEASSQTILQAITLTLEDVDSSCLKTTTITTNNNSNASSCTSSANTATTAINLISANLKYQSSPSSSSPLIANSISVSNNLCNGVSINGISSNPKNSCSYADCLNKSSAPIMPIMSSSENVWKKRNLENSVIIPQETQVKNSCDLWSGIVAGKYKKDDDKATNQLRKLSSDHSLPNGNLLSDKRRSYTLNELHDHMEANNEQGTIKLKVANINSPVNGSPANSIKSNSRHYYNTLHSNINNSSNNSSTSSSPTFAKQTVNNFDSVKKRNGELHSQQAANILNPHRIYKRNLSGFGRGKFVTSNASNLNNNSVGKLDRSYPFPDTSNASDKQQTVNNAANKSKNPFFYLNN